MAPPTQGRRVEDNTVRDLIPDGGGNDGRSELGSEAAVELSSPGGNRAHRAGVQRAEVAVAGQATDVEIVNGDESEAPKRRALATDKSPSELAKPGANNEAPALVDRTQEFADKFKDAGDAGTDNPNAVPRISVELENKEKPSEQEPHFVIKQNGEIEMRGDPEQLKTKDVRIVLEREAGDVNPTEAQKKAADELVQYLNERMKQNFPQDADKIQLNDKDDVISREVENGLKPPPQQEDMTPETRETIGRTNRLEGSGGMNMPRTATDGMGSFETRGVPRQPGETDQMAATKEAVAGLFRPDSEKPYETIRRHPDGDYRVGRYGFSGNQLLNWINSLSPEQIDKLIAEGKLPKDFANPEFLEKFKEMAQKMANGEQPSEDDLKKFLPKEAQETVAGALIDQYGAKFGNDPGKISAAMLSGKAPDQISDADLSTPGAQEMINAGKRLYDVAVNRQQSDSGRYNGERVPEGDRRDLIVQALQIAGEPVNESTIAAVNTIVQHESSWNPNARNDWDVNARNGVPSQGLAQTIPPTFEAHKDRTGQVEAAGQRNTILNPLANLVAAINYSQSRYGGVERVPGVRSTRAGLAYKPY